jgi:uncharacterized protein (TIGR03118 family)
VSRTHSRLSKELAAVKLLRLCFAANFLENGGPLTIPLAKFFGGHTTVPGGFADATLPAGYSPYNIQTIQGKLYVEYANVDPITHRPTTTANTGVVDVFDVNGNLLQRLATNSHLNSPWGVTLAPATGFGDFSGDILVGNFGDGTISAFNSVTLLSAGTIDGPSGTPLVNDGLWALNFRGAGTFLMLALTAIPLAWRKVSS